MSRQLAYMFAYAYSQIVLMSNVVSVKPWTLLLAEVKRCLGPEERGCSRMNRCLSRGEENGRGGVVRGRFKVLNECGIRKLRAID